jgi:hypothetical protein
MLVGRGKFRCRVKAEWVKLPDNCSPLGREHSKTGSPELIRSGYRRLCK